MSSHAIVNFLSKKKELTNHAQFTQKEKTATLGGRITHFLGRLITEHSVKGVIFIICCRGTALVGAMRIWLEKSDRRIVNQLHTTDEEESGSNVKDGSSS